MFFIWPIRDEFGIKRLPVANFVIIFINIVVFFFFAFQPSYSDVVNTYGFIPSRFSWLTIFTSMFLHGSLMHLIGNMWYLYLIGDNLEDRWGHFLYFLFYLLAGVIAVLFYSAFIPDSARDIPSIGASGAVSGVLGAYVILFPKSRITFWYYIFVFFRIYSGTFDIFAWFWVSFWFLQQLIGMFININSNATAGIAFGAHVGGFLVGLFIAFLTRSFQKARYIRNVCAGQNALYEISGEGLFKVMSFDQQVEIFNIEKEIERLINENNEREAAILYGKALKKYPGLSIPSAYKYKFAEMLQNIGFFGEAIDAYRKFLRDNPFNNLADNALYNLGKIYLDKGEKDRANQCFRQIVLFYPYSEIYDEAMYALSGLKNEQAFMKK